MSPVPRSCPPGRPPRYWFRHHDTVGSTATCCCWLRCVRGYDARIWRICDAAAALLFAADAVVVDAAAAAAASRSDGRPTDEGVLPECGGELDHFVSAKCAAWMYRMRRSSTFGKGARWVCALSLAGRAGCGAGSGIQTCAHGGKIQLYEQLKGKKRRKKTRCLVQVHLYSLRIFCHFPQGGNVTLSTR